ncbi:hypothetical protein [Ferrimonas balearica]|uniref:hypothetical protein n=1 Tax=Ferrimonas balearica TaxID=44012 RepID=UPI001C99F112|nr:hypothetical protein [Ferrimonas balearica]MBY5991538.1 hypothetical protein [Ferrimonas balearica]
MKPCQDLLSELTTDASPGAWQTRRFQANLLDAADALLDLGPDLYTLRQLEMAFDRRRAIPAQVVIKLALSKRILCDLRDPYRFTVVVPLLADHRRLLTPQEHPQGEACLQRKLEQLQWLFGSALWHDWRMILVDDGCPDHSGRIARRQLLRLGRSRRAQVHFVERAGENRSHKGAAITLGLHQALAHWGTEHHLVMVSNAAIDVNLGQLGLLAQPMLAGRLWQVVGSRRLPYAVARQNAPNPEALLVEYLWRRMMPQLNGLGDPFSGFCGFRAQILASLLEGVTELGPAQALEWPLKAQLSEPDSIKEVAVAHLGQAEQGTVPALGPLPMLQAASRLYRRYLPQLPVSEQFSTLVEGLDAPRWEALVGAMAGPLLAAAPEDLARRCLFSPQHLAARARVKLSRER